MASGNTLIILMPQSYEPPATGFASLDIRNGHPVLAFSTATISWAIWTGVMPQHYAGTTGTVTYIHYAMKNATSNTVDWTINWERIGDGSQNIDSDGFATDESATGTTVPGTAGLVDIVGVTATDGTPMDSVAVGETFRLKLTQTTLGSATDNSQVLAVEIREA